MTCAACGLTEGTVKVVDGEIAETLGVQVDDEICQVCLDEAKEEISEGEDIYDDLFGDEDSYEDYDDLDDFDDDL